MIFLAYLIIGLIAGLLSGTLGIGGGIIIVPALNEIFIHTGFPVSRAMQSAIATSLAVMIFTTGSAALSHLKLGHLKTILIMQFLPGMCVGVIWGSVIAHQLSSLELQLFFSLLLLFVAYRLWFNKKSNSAPKPGWLNLGFSSFAIGLISGLLGVGGGVLSVPYLLRFKISARQAVALGTFFSLVAAIIGTLSWWFLSHSTSIHHATSFSSYINWPAAIIAGCAGVLIAPWAVKWAKHLSEVHMRRALAILLTLLCIQKFMSWLLVVI